MSKLSEIAAPLDSPARPCCNETWEEAYRRFETPEEEIRKFLRRLRRVGAAAWPRNARIVELFCGRGNGLKALERLGFLQVEGVDLSPGLLAQYQGAARCYVADCRSLPFPDASKDIAIVQGGLHHLEVLPDDLEAVLYEIHRVLGDAGLLVVVEPWTTPFLKGVHWAARQRWLRRAWNKLDAFAVMTENELTTYEQWLGQPELILQRLHHWFVPVRQWGAWGKLTFVGRKRVSG